MGERSANTRTQTVRATQRCATFAASAPEARTLVPGDVVVRCYNIPTPSTRARGTLRALIPRASEAIVDLNSRPKNVHGRFIPLENFLLQKCAT
jgi:hypothetical protein